MFDQEKRIQKLEKEVAEQREIIKDLLSQQTKWITLSEANNKFGISKSVIRKRILDGVLIHLKDWKRNGRNYLINPKAIKKIT